MKKLILAVAIATIGFAASAATVVWSSGKIQTPGADGNGWSGSTLSAATSGDILAQIYFWDNLSDAGNLEKALTGITGTTSSSSTKQAKAFKGETSDSFAVNQTYYTQLILTTTSDTFPAATLTSEVGSFMYDGGMETPSLDFFSGTGFKESFAGTGGAFGASGWVAAPEPTSGLLLLLGLAGLALKRKRA